MHFDGDLRNGLLLFNVLPFLVGVGYTWIAASTVWDTARAFRADFAAILRVGCYKAKWVKRQLARLSSLAEPTSNVWMIENINE